MSEKKIGDSQYRVQPMLAKAAIVLFAEVSRILGPSLPELLNAYSADGAKDSNVAAAKAMRDVISNVEPVKLADLIERIVELAEIQEGSDYRKVIFDNDFTGDLKGAVPVMVFVLTEQFGDFFTELLASGKAATGQGNSQN